jgi:ribulose kinase
VQEKSSRTIDARIVVANVEEITLSAGTFETFKIEVYDNYAGKLSSEHWYSPKVKWFVKNKTYLANGVREEELLSFKSD